MEQIKLKAVLREERGKQDAKKLRNSGWIPAIVYHRGEQAVSISVGDKDLSKIIHAAGGENLLINLTIEKEKKKMRSALIKEVQYDPVKRFILHVDFNEISLTEKILVEVEVVAQGEAVGVKQEGGVMDHPVRMLKVQCLPMDIPKHIDVDVSGLALNGSIHIRDLVLSDKIKVLNDPDTLLFHVKLPVEPKADDGTEVAPEVEVLREKKEEAPAAGAKAGEKKEESKAKEAAKPEKK